MAKGKGSKRKQGDISEAFANLQDILASKEESLKEREEAFEKKVRLFEQENPQTGNGSDIIHLNVGGSTHVAVFRRTLTHFEHSMIPSKFSGRWDDSLEKDAGGKFFIDDDPVEFMKLIEYLRMSDKRKRLDVDVPKPKATFAFLWMLEYYELMLSIYPLNWNLIWGKGSTMTQPTTPNDPFIIETGSSMCAFSLDLEGRPQNAASLRIVLERGSKGQIGWARKDCLEDGEKIGYYVENCLVLDLEEQCWADSSDDTNTNIELSTRETDIAIVCLFNRKSNAYVVQVEESDPNISRRVSRPSKTLMTPHISLIGKATISELMYSY